MGDSVAFDKDRRCFGAKSTVCLSENSLSAWPTPKGSPIALIGGDNVHHQLTIPIVVPHLAEVIDVQIVSPKFALVSDVVEAACFAIGIQETWFFGLTASAEGLYAPQVLHSYYITERNFFMVYKRSEFLLIMNVIISIISLLFLLIMNV